MIVTSLFIFIPTYYNRLGNPMFSVFLLKTVASSISHWYWYQHNSIAHWMDRYCAACVIVYALLLNWSWRQIALCLVAVICFLCGRSSKDIAWKRNLHLVFRYFAFWMCMCVASVPEARIVLTLTLLYVFVVYATTFWVTRRPTVPGSPHSASLTTM